MRLTAYINDTDLLGVMAKRPLGLAFVDILNEAMRHLADEHDRIHLHRNFNTAKSRKNYEDVRLVLMLALKLAIHRGVWLPFKLADIRFIAIRDCYNEAYPAWRNGLMNLGLFDILEFDPDAETYEFTQEALNLFADIIIGKGR